MSKIEYCNKRNINYQLFVFPDRSIVLKDYLPFEVGEPYRLIDQFSDVLTDLLPLFTDVDFILTDTHMTPITAVKCGIYMVYKLHPEKTLEYYANSIWQHIVLESDEITGDLIKDTNWSYNYDEYYKKHLHDFLLRAKVKDYYVDLNKQLPPEFRNVGKRETHYYRNENSISNKKCLFLTASSGIYGKIPLIAYYREVIYYWDHWYFNQDLVDWFEPDDIIDFRPERFLANRSCSIIKEGSHVKIPINMKIVDFSNEDNNLTIVVDLKDYHLMPVKTYCDILIDDNLFKRFELSGEITNTFEINSDELKNKIHILTISFESTDKTLAYSHKWKLRKNNWGNYEISL